MAMRWNEVRRVALAVALVSTAASTTASAQRGGPVDPPGVTRGAAQPNQNKWNAKGPWGKTERSAPMEAQKKAPFKLFDNVYYVGLQTVSAYLVTTSAGLVLIDTGYVQSVDWLLEGVRAVGFDPANIRYAFVTHSHLDHAGGAAKVKQVSGARVGLSAEDWVVVERQQADARQRENFPPLARDLVLKDAESITVGDQTFKFYVTPGHTPGATSVEFTARDGARSYRVVVPGGLGLQYAAEFGPMFKSSITRLKGLGPWDVALGNHPFLAPKDLAEIEGELKTRGQGPHPAVLGPARVDAFFADILTIVDEKLIEEPPPAGRAPRAGPR